MKQLNEVVRMQQLAGITEIKVNNPTKNPKRGTLLKWCENNKESISKLNPDYEEVILESEVYLMDISYWTEDDFNSPYENYNYQMFQEDWNKYEGTVVIMGEELASCFLTFFELPLEFANIVTGNDYGFFGARINNQNSFIPQQIGSMSFYMTFGIPDPGS
jgi:hypothetical protein